MSQTDRAPNEVAKHFYEKYGHDEAVSIISAQITSDKQKQGSEFWLDVLQILDAYKKSASKGIEVNAQGMKQKDDGYFSRQTHRD